jgi:hypothetical protein
MIFVSTKLWSTLLEAAACQFLVYQCKPINAPYARAIEAVQFYALTVA